MGVTIGEWEKQRESSSTNEWSSGNKTVSGSSELREGETKDWWEKLRILTNIWFCTEDANIKTLINKVIKNGRTIVFEKQSTHVQGNEDATIS